MGTGNFYAGGRHFDKVAGNFDHVTPNSAEVTINSVKVASNFDAGRHNFTNLAINSGAGTHNFDLGSRSQINRLCILKTKPQYIADHNNMKASVGRAALPRRQVG